MRILICYLFFVTCAVLISCSNDTVTPVKTNPNSTVPSITVPQPNDTMTLAVWQAVNFQVSGRCPHFNYFDLQIDTAPSFPSSGVIVSRSEGFPLDYTNTYFLDTTKSVYYPHACTVDSSNNLSPYSQTQKLYVIHP